MTFSKLILCSEFLRLTEFPGLLPNTDQNFVIDPDADQSRSVEIDQYSLTGSVKC